MEDSAARNPLEQPVTPVQMNSSLQARIQVKILTRKRSDPNEKPPLDAEFAAYWAILMKYGIERSSLPEPFSFLESHCMELQQLADMAFEVLTVPATSSEVERAFSQAGNILDGCRWSLSDENLDRETFLRHNKVLLKL